MQLFWKNNKLEVMLVVLTLAVFVVFVSTRSQQIPDELPAVEVVSEARDLGLTWLMNNQLPNGRFLYILRPARNEIPNSNNSLRQLMGSRVVSVEAGRSHEWDEIHQKNLDYVFDRWYREDENGGYIYFDDKSKLGSNAMLLRTLVYSPYFETYKTEAAAVAKGILFLQQPNGSFVPWYIEPGYAYDAKYLLYFYSGEATLALLEYAEKTGDEAVLRAAIKAAEHYLDEYVVNIEANYNPAYVPWHTMAFARLYKLTGEQKYADAIFTMNDRLLELLDREVFIGRFYKVELEAEGQQAPHSSSDAVYTEGLLYAYEVAQLLEDRAHVESYGEAIALALNRLMALQYDEEVPGFDAEPSMYVGAIPIHETRPDIRVDTTQHALDAMEKYLKLFGEE